jgi:uncharacterized protein YggE
MPEQVIVMAKEMAECYPRRGFMLVLAALLIAAGMLGSSYMLAQVDYAPDVDVSDITSTPNIYVSSEPPEHVISVSATASEKVTPDLLLIQVRVQTEDENAKDSQERNAVVMDGVMDELERLGVPEEEIQTSGYRVDVISTSEYICDKRCHYETVIIGYRTTHTLALSLKELDGGGEIIDAVTGVGTNETFIDYVDFTLQPETRRQLEKDLLEEASMEAEEKAKNIAQGLGVTLGKPVRASESVYYPYYSYRGGYDLAYAAEAAPPTALSPGEVEASATVNVGFEIA